MIYQIDNYHVYKSNWNPKFTIGEYKLNNIKCADDTQLTINAEGKLK